MEILTEPLGLDMLKKMSERMFGNLVKAVVDIERGLIVVDAELHSDQEALLLENGSKQENLWGINLYPGFGREDPRFLEFDSMINLRPWQNNTSRSVDDPALREKIQNLVGVWVV